MGKHKKVGMRQALFIMPLPVECEYLRSRLMCREHEGDCWRHSRWFHRITFGIGSVFPLEENQDRNMGQGLGKVVG